MAALAFQDAAQETDPCEAFHTTVEMDQCYMELRDKRQAKVKKLVTEIRALLKERDDKRLSAAFEKAHKGWQSMADSWCQINLIFYEGGSFAGLSAAICRCELLQEHLDRLEAFKRDLSL